MIASEPGKLNPSEVYTTKGCGAGNGPILILAHGAGAPADSPFMEVLADALGKAGVTCLRFEFPYMRQRRTDGRKRPPDRQDKLLAHFRRVLSWVRESYGEESAIYLGGKSMGGRMATILASEPELEHGFQGVVCFGYPFHPPGKPDRWRTGHFDHLWCRVLILQGTRDPFGRPDEVTAELAERVNPQMRWIEGGNHDLVPLARQKVPQDDLINWAAKQAAEFMKAQA